MTQPSEMPECLRLTAGDLRLSLAPGVGGAITGLTRRNVPILRETPPEALLERRAGLCSSYAMIPYSNRIADAKFSFGGERFQLARNFGDNPHSLHGNGWQREWTVVSAASETAVLCLDHDPGESPQRQAEWPFAYRATQRFVLEPSVLTITLTLENRDTRPMPAGFGLHPYFDRAGASLRYEAGTVWQSDARLLPTVRSPVPAGWDATKSRAVDGMTDVDHCFEDWNGPAEIAYPGRDEGQGIGIRIIADDLFSKLVIFRADARDFFAVEPVSHMVDAVNRMDVEDHGLHVLSPGERLEGTVRFEITEGR
ncbi:aldose 1-epimerase [Jiella mangrovi]|uniref:Aldose 1-epimerase n=1 Tax=Jiella mangrovi TaxID=2821407 RepID=A0ABS4BI60_9HYPH|nr:aldose 1-epimerase [Jiella mangrovi]MBP0616452.1 aldose 1-epimerase [Jiella mangrovi]